MKNFVFSMKDVRIVLDRIERLSRNLPAKEPGISEISIRNLQLKEVRKRKRKGGNALFERGKIKERKKRNEREQASKQTGRKEGKVLSLSKHTFIHTHTHTVSLSLFLSSGKRCVLQSHRASWTFTHEETDTQAARNI